ncbi:MAG: CZB domain-containing protein [Halobacteriovoraceae bacterium]|nr:CZB domain-containing protein [Halobacteriovoraceae bacterium]
MFVTLAKIDHILWKIGTYQSIINQRPMIEFVDHKNCRLGKWFLHGEGAKNFSKIPFYSSLEGPHALVHEGTRKILRHVTDISKHIHDLEIGVKEMEEASDQVFNILDRILDAKSNQPKKAA